MTVVPANRVEVFDITAPAGTLSTAPLEVATPIGIGNVIGLELVIPAGHRGTTGLYFAIAHGRAIPLTRGSWIKGNDDTLRWDLTEYLDAGSWSVFVYNTDIYAHSWQVRYLIDDFNRHEQPQVGAFAAPPLLV